MYKNNKLSKILVSSSMVFLTGYQALGPVFAEDKPSMNYIQGAQEEQKNNETNNTSEMKVESRSQEQVSMDEGIAAEQIIVKINDEGYVTSHGDHYHYYSGLVPEDSIFIESLLLDKSKSDQVEVVSQVKGGKIVKVDGQYFVDLEAGLQADNIRSHEELALQAFGLDPKDAKAIVQLKEELAISPESQIMTEKERTPEEVSKDKGIDSPHVIVYLTDQAFVSLHGIDFHVFMTDLPEEFQVLDSVLVDDSYTFKQEDSVKELAEANIVKYKEGYALYLKDQHPHIKVVSLKELKTEAKKVIENYKEFGRKDQESIDKVKAGEIDGSGQRNASGQYVTSDGYVFSPYDVIQDLGDGFIVPHEDHFHFIPKSDLSPSELNIALSVLGKKGNNSQSNNGHDNKQTDNGLNKDKDKVIHLVKDDKVNNEGPYTTSDGYVFTVESITKVETDGMITKHGNHFHFVPYKDLNHKELKAAKEYIKKHFNIDLEMADEGKSNTEEKPAFDYTKVTASKVLDGVQGYIYEVNGKDYFQAKKDLDKMQISFAELQLNINMKNQYAYQVTPIKEGDLEPGLYIALSEIPLHAGNASYDTGEAFIIPHIDHIHVAPYSQLTKEEIATIKYLMQHPEFRPDPWTKEGHDEAQKQMIKYVPNATPEDKRSGMKNRDIIHTAKEVNEALNKGIFANDKGYIFSPEDLKESDVFIWKDGTFNILNTQGTYTTINKADLPKTMQDEIDKVLQERQVKEEAETTETTEGVSNKTLIDFLAKHYEVANTEVYYQWNDDSFLVKLPNEESIHISKEQALNAYHGKGQLPQKEMKETTETSSENIQASQVEASSIPSTEVEVTTEAIQTSELAETTSEIATD